MKDITQASLWARTLYEFLGTAWLVFSFNCGYMQPLGYFIWWIIAYKVSGAHFNPAITVAVYITERCGTCRSFCTFLLYLGA